MRTIVLNINNVVLDGNNNRLVYRFPNSVAFKNTYVAVQSVTMFYSWYNISASLGNNTFSFTYVNGSGGTNWKTVVFPDGIYDITTLNEYLQFTCLANNWYMTTAAGLNVFFLTFEVNPTSYGIQICCYQVPSAAINPKLYVASSLGFPTTPFVVQVTIPSAFNKIIGYPAGWVSTNYYGSASSSGFLSGVPYVWSSSVGIVSYMSNTAPQVNPNPSVYLAISSINNPYSLPSSIIYAVTPSNGIGAVIIDKPPQFCWNKFIDGTYNELTVNLLGSDLSPIKIYDPNMTIMLAIRDNDEFGGK